ncbi:glycosyltransferase family 2 protein [Panacibacter sp. DH6]|uniref:Glycosyltransferase family 2 protein n=1 Tax=Panacibacter microcysteis TaxID=2793269 RepID=A0A931E778_9BACT|nr:glycosyltransferase [Panacibacter microcysteis]MBG9377462.1 glycosyltransferase family 2 protein [Panacibacter microcysteis]
MDELSMSISLIICTYNRDRYLPEALESIRLQTAEPGSFQLVIVDNKSTDNTHKIAQTFIRNNPHLNVKYVLETNKGLSFARNRGAAEADAPVLCYIDDDALLSPAFVSEMTLFFNNHPAAAGAGGKVIPKYEDGIEPAWMNKYLNGFVGRVDHGTKITRFTKKMKYPAGCNMTYKKDIILKAGGFNNNLTFRSDDKYIFYKIKELSDEIYYLPDAYVHHYIDSYRLAFDNFRKLFLKTGNEEKIRVRTTKGMIGVAVKALEFLFKFGASVLIWLLFMLKGQSIKGKYVFLSQWFTLKGFFKNNVFVR